jgi:hypothetical protein
MTETETKWSERVQQWRASGRTAKEFAAGRDFQGSTLRYWASHLRGKGDREAPEVKGPPRVKMARVVRVAAKNSFSSVVIQLGAAQVVVSAGFDRDLLREVVEALGGTR